MAFLGVKEFKEIQEKYSVIDNFNVDRLKNGAYELSLGKEVYLTDNKDKKVSVLNADNRGIDINPGQFALLLTKEKVSVPKHLIGFISIKAGEKLKGLINVSGFHVDPGFNDHLLFSVYNAGPSTIVLNFEDPYFPIWFAELKNSLSEEEAYNDNNEHYKRLDHIPSKYIEFLKRGELTSPRALSDKINEVETNLKSKKENNEWLFKILIGLGAAILMKLGWDWKAYERGYDDGENAKIIQRKIDESIENKNIDSIISSRIDNLNRSKNDTNNKK
ncbi:MAG: hypothetical protein BGO86_02765 [Chryseobacterium sp. 36-9]|nr:MAG: hypothetical protein BGO86_02765 [Chryseobacterium sp. 36-9]